MPDSDKNMTDVERMLFGLNYLIEYHQKHRQMMLDSESDADLDEFAIKTLWNALNWIKQRNPEIDHGADQCLLMQASLYLPMRKGETQEQAEDRMIDLCDSAGIVLAGWTDSHVEEDG